VAAWQANWEAATAHLPQLLASELAVLADVAWEEAAERQRELEAHESLLSKAAADAQVVGEAFSGLSSAVGSATADAIGEFFMSSLDDRKQEAARGPERERAGGWRKAVTLSARRLRGGPAPQYFALACAKCKLLLEAV
jgi:hypothetical protein